MRGDIFTVPIDELPFNPLDEDDLVRHANQMIGKTISDLDAAVRKWTEKDEKNKGGFGRTAELWFRLKSNQRQEADLPETPWKNGRGKGVEIKTIPIKQLKSEEFRSKERTVISMIDFRALAREVWATASVRGKMARILFIAYWHNYDDPATSTVQGSFTWTPPEGDYPQFEKDWTAMQEAVKAGVPKHISESLGRYLGACTKGSKDPKHRTLPNGEEAHPRAWALKAAYTWTHVSNKLSTTGFVQASSVLSSRDPKLTLDDFDIVKETGQTRLERVERAVLGALHELEGKSIQDACEAAGVDYDGDDKNLAARIMAKAIGVKEDEHLLELASAGVRVKTMHFRGPGMHTGAEVDRLAFESMSFPLVNLMRMHDEDWIEDSVDFRDQVQRLLIVPTYSRDSDSDQLKRTVGRAFLWSPTPGHWQLIEEDWREMQGILRAGGVIYRYKLDASGNPRRNKKGELMRENDMPGTRQKRAAHMRPKASDATDEYEAPDGKGGKAKVTKQCLWLNGWLIRRLLLACDADPAAEGVTI